MEEKDGGGKDGEGKDGRWRKGTEGRTREGKNGGKCNKRGSAMICKETVKIMERRGEREGWEREGWERRGEREGWERWGRREIEHTLKRANEKA
jgi:hypothetical protein